MLVSPAHLPSLPNVELEDVHLPHLLQCFTCNPFLQVMCLEISVQILKSIKYNSQMATGSPRPNPTRLDPKVPQTHGIRGPGPAVCSLPSQTSESAESEAMKTNLPSNTAVRSFGSPQGDDDRDETPERRERGTVEV